ncbi:MAG: sulfite exporter TauE/SafE family protein [Acidobacteriaceae bacterium]|nr:sulfite exporter TauE/SafE family protein [Acidobacteriaceae bacterium]
MTFVFLFAVAFVGGALNAVAGGGSFLALPALMSAGIGAVSANATTTLAMWPGSLSSVIAYRREVGHATSWLWRLGVTSLVGGLLGAWLLVRTSDARFLHLLPWLMLAAALTFTFGGHLVARLRPKSAASALHGDRSQVPWWILLFQLMIAIYGGYFGGGMGIMMLAGFAVAGMTDIHEMNALKTVLAVAINGLALAEFIIDGAISWPPGIVMVAGGIAGGYLGAAIARKLPQPFVRITVIAVAWVMTAYFFLR